MIRSDASVCVIIAAYNAAATIGRAIDSALAEPEVSEVRVIDDASTDGTAAAASALDDGTGRLSVCTLPANAGPSGARNVAIAASDAAFIAILDADDFFLPGRFAALFAISDWDLVADNIVFVRDPGTVQHARAEIGRHRIEPRRLTAIGFVEGSISQRGRYKHEFGFLKPVMSRAFLDRHGLRYAEQMRLSEDYHLYVRALIAGARFRLSAGCHYVAVEHAHSLSSSHGERDLEAVERAIVELLALSAADCRSACHPAATSRPGRA